MVGMITSKVTVYLAQKMIHKLVATTARFPIIVLVYQPTAFQFHTCEDNNYILLRKVVTQIV